jgi:hypothetical protein
VCKTCRRNATNPRDAFRPLYAKWRWQICKNVSISRGIRPVKPIHLAGGVGRAVTKCWTRSLVWHSANYLPWRNGAAEARAGRCCHRLPGARSFPCVRAGGKVTPAKSQPFVISDVKLQKYFANRVAKFGKVAKSSSVLVSHFLTGTMRLCFLVDRSQRWP